VSKPRFNADLRLATLQAPRRPTAAAALALDAAGSIHVGGYAEANLAGTNAGDEDVYLSCSATGGDPVWIRQFGWKSASKIGFLGLADDSTDRRPATSRTARATRALPRARSR